MNEIRADQLHLHCGDARPFLQSLPDSQIQCVICDPPFGIGEADFDKHYARDSSHVLEGYSSAPADNTSYQTWCASWIHQLPRIMKADGTVYIVCAWNHLCDVEMAIRSAPAPGLTVVNHIIWKYNFGVYAQRKFITSHYHILRCAIGSNIPVFYPRAYYNEKEKTATGHSAQYMDMEDVWVIPKEYAKGETKNVNKLPDTLVEKMIRYATKPGDTIADFFLGNFTTAYVGRRLGRNVIGCEINPKAFEEHAGTIASIPVLPTSSSHEKPSVKPPNAGKRLTAKEKQQIVKRYDVLRDEGNNKKESLNMLETEFGRGHFSLINILKEVGK